MDGKHVRTKQFSKVQAGINSQNQYINLFMQAHVGICIFKGSELIIELANDPILKIWGKTNNIIGLPLNEALPEVINTQYPQLLLDVYKNGVTHYANENSAYLIRNGREEKVYFNFVYQPLYEQDGSISGVMAIANEVTEQVEARIKIEESEKRFRSLVLGADVATAIYIGEQMVIQLANEAMISLWGKDPSVIGKTVREALPELEEQPFHQLLQNVYKTGNTYKATEDRADLVVNGKLQSFYFNFSYKALYNTDGSIYGILNMAVDVTEQVIAKKKLAKNEEILKAAVEERTQELQTTNENLKRSNIELERFAHVASHDMKEPVRKVKLFANMAEANLAHSPGTARSHLEKVKNAADRLANMVEGILKYSSISVSKHAIDVLDLSEIIKSIQTDLELTIDEKGADIQTGELPKFEGMSFLIYQLFYNLINNSLKFSKENEKLVITICGKKISSKEFSGRLTLDPDADYIEIILKDNGIGFNEAYAESIFNPFYRLHSKDVYEGTGLGLALCKNIVERHKGFIWAHGEENKGASFTLLLPEKQA